MFRCEIGEVKFSNNWVAFFRSDGGGEYTGHEFREELLLDGTFHETTAADTPEQNGLSERMNGTLVTRALAMLIDSGLPRSFWGEAMVTAAYMISRSPAAGLKGVTPYEALFGRRVDPSMFRTFGCIAYALIPKDQRNGKFGDKARKCVLLGYTYGKKAYRLMDLGSKTIFSSRHVRFDENSRATKSFAPDVEDGSNVWQDLLMPLGSKPGTTPKGDGDDDTPVTIMEPTPVTVGGLRTPTQSRIPIPPSRQPSYHPSPAPPTPQVIPTPPTRPSRANARAAEMNQQRRHTSPLNIVAGERRSNRLRVPAQRNAGVNLTAEEWKERYITKRNTPPNAHPPPPETPAEVSGSTPTPAEPTAVEAALEEDLEALFAGVASENSNDNLPPSLKEALEGPNGDKWRAALDEEIASLVANKVYNVVKIPKGVKPITSKAVMRLKFDKNGNIERWKIRLVARGFTQKEGVDYDEIFAPVANLESIRIILALAAKYDLELDQMDFSTAYLNGELEEDLYLLPPPEVGIEDGYCWKLERSLYGLKQAGRDLE